MAKKSQTTATADVTEVQQTEPKFSFEQIVASAKYANRKDMVRSVLIEKDRLYTMSEVDRLVDQYEKRKVK